MGATRRTQRGVLRPPSSVAPKSALCQSSVLPQSTMAASPQQTETYQAHVPCRDMLLTTFSLPHTAAVAPAPWLPAQPALSAGGTPAHALQACCPVPYYQRIGTQDGGVVTPSTLLVAVIMSACVHHNLHRFRPEVNTPAGRRSKRQLGALQLAGPEEAVPPCAAGCSAAWRARTGGAGAGAAGPPKG